MQDALSLHSDATDRGSIVGDIESAEIWSGFTSALVHKLCMSHMCHSYSVSGMSLCLPLSHVSNALSTICLLHVQQPRSHSFILFHTSEACVSTCEERTSECGQNGVSKRIFKCPPSSKQRQVGTPWLEGRCTDQRMEEGWSERSWESV